MKCWCKCCEMPEFNFSIVCTYSHRSEPWTPQAINVVQVYTLNMAQSGCQRQNKRWEMAGMEGEGGYIPLVRLCSLHLCKVSLEQVSASQERRQTTVETSRSVSRRCGPEQRHRCLSNFNSILNLLIAVSLSQIQVQWFQTFPRTPSRTCSRPEYWP